MVQLIVNGKDFFVSIENLKKSKVLSVSLGLNNDDKIEFDCEIGTNPHLLIQGLLTLDLEILLLCGSSKAEVLEMIDYLKIPSFDTDLLKVLNKSHGITIDDIVKINGDIIEPFIHSFLFPLKITDYDYNGIVHILGQKPEKVENISPLITMNSRYPLTNKFQKFSMIENFSRPAIYTTIIQCACGFKDFEIPCDPLTCTEHKYKAFDNFEEKCIQFINLENDLIEYSIDYRNYISPDNYDCPKVVHQSGCFIIHNANNRNAEIIITKTKKVIKVTFPEYDDRFKCRNIMFRNNWIMFRFLKWSNNSIISEGCVDYKIHASEILKLSETNDTIILNDKNGAMSNLIVDKYQLYISTIISGGIVISKDNENNECKRIKEISFPFCVDYICYDKSENFLFIGVNRNNPNIDSDDEDYDENENEDKQEQQDQLLDIEIYIMDLETFEYMSYQTYSSNDEEIFGQGLDKALSKMFLNVVNESTIKYWKWKINESKYFQEE